tara:strand:+ start:231 stop:392 length:162 start_codon:yes stop_codon:yes gene_type:complete
MIFLDVWEWVANLFFFSISSLILAISIFIWAMLLSMGRKIATKIINTLTRIKK